MDMEPHIKKLIEQGVCRVRAGEILTSFYHQAYAKGFDTGWNSGLQMLKKKVLKKHSEKQAQTP